LVSEYADTLDQAIRQNLEALVEIRDNAVHFFNKDLALAKAIHEIGAASLKNYINATRRWFGVDLSRHGIFLLPLAFIQIPDTFEGVTVNGEERHLLEYLAKLRAASDEDGTRDFSVAMAIEIRVKRSKDAEAVPFTLSTHPDALPVTVGEEQITETYPWDFEILTNRLQKRYSNFKRNPEYHRRRKEILKRNPKLAHDRLLDPAKPAGLKKTYYSPNILKDFDTLYERATLSTDPTAATVAG